MSSINLRSGVWIVLVAIIITSCMLSCSSEEKSENTPVSLMFQVDSELIEPQDTLMEVGLIYAVPTGWQAHPVGNLDLTENELLSVDALYLSPDSASSNFFYRITNNDSTSSIRAKLLESMADWEGRSQIYSHGEIEVEQWLFTKGEFVNLKLFMKQGSKNAISEFLMSRKRYNEISKQIESSIGSYKFINQ